jgi:GTP-binding protein
MNRPVVAIVGRPNVGKSALFNRISGRQISLVYDRPGVTRDRIAAECRWRNREFTLVDTGGIGLDDQTGFREAIEREVAIALETASEIILVADGREGVHPIDRELARTLRRSGRPYFLAVNKIDSGKQSDYEVEFSELGIPSIWPVSAAHGLGIEELMEAVSAGWPDVEETADPEKIKEERPVRVAIVGRPNVGKSSLVNALIAEHRVIVSDVPGTTRDAVDIEFRHGAHRYCLIDTAGMRKKSRVSDPLEQAMTGRSAHAINRADLCVLVVDGMDGVGEQEKKIAGLIGEARKPCVVVVNKWDLVRQVRGEKGAKSGRDEVAWKEEYAEGVRRALFFVDYAPVRMVSAKESLHIGGVVRAISEVEKARRTRISTGVLNRLLARALERQLPPRRRGRQFKIYYATQVPDASPVPTIKAFVNDTRLLVDSYASYLDQQIRREYPCVGCPIVWQFKNREKTGKSSARSS